MTTLRVAIRAVIPIVMQPPTHSMNEIVRHYMPADRGGCLEVFDGNVPDFFNAAERSDFARFLDEQAVAWAYQIVERWGQIVACGGLTVAFDGLSAGLCWGMVERKLHNTGLGSLLTTVRLDTARAVFGLKQVRLDTSQRTQGFYRRFGFAVERIVPDGYGSGLDRWDMILRL